MIRMLLLLLTVVSLLSCRKLIEDKLTGDWRLDRSYTRTLFGKDDFETGYEDGIFHFDESGAASYTSATDTLTGFWDSDFYNVPTGNGGSQTYKFLRIEMADFQNNQLLIWDFDDFHFRNNWKCIHAVEFRLGRERCYEFVKP